MKKHIQKILILAVMLDATITRAVDDTSSSGYNPGNTTSSSVPKLSLTGIVTYIGQLMTSLLYVIIGASLVMFLYGIFRLSFVDGQKPESREQSRKFMVWGIWSLFVMVSVWGFVKILQLSIFGSGNLIAPQLK